MKIIPSSRRHRYVAGVITLLITIALVVGMVGCAPFLLQYSFTISSTAGGAVTTPGEGTFTYFAGTVVGLVAEAEEGYYFVNWTGDIATISCRCRSTTITMSGDYAITADFAPEIPGNLEIRDWNDLDDIRDNLGGNYLLMNDLDSTTADYEELASPTANAGKGWQPIGAEDGPFTGSFDGQGYEIRDLFINRPDDAYVGLFGWVSEGGVIKNLGVVNADVTGYGGVGGLVAWNAGIVRNSYSSGNVTSGLWVGGLMGGNAGTMSNSYFTGNVTGYGGVGGLVGFNGEGGIVSNSYSTGNFTGEELVGGLVAGNAGIVSNSYSTGNVTGNLDVGGLVGENHGTVSDSFWDTETSGQATSDGGTGKTTAEMQDIATFSGAAWDIIAVANPGIRNPSYTWNIVDAVTYPFLSGQS